MRTETQCQAATKRPSECRLCTPSKLHRALGNLVLSPSSPGSAPSIICKGRGCSLFPLSLPRGDTSGLGAALGKHRGRAPLGMLHPGPLFPIPPHPPYFTWGCGLHGDWRLVPGGPKSQRLPLPSPGPIPLRPGRSPAQPRGRQRQVPGVRGGCHAPCPGGRCDPPIGLGKRRKEEEEEEERGSRRRWPGALAARRGAGAGDAGAGAGGGGAAAAAAAPPADYAGGNGSVRSSLPAPASPCGWHSTGQPAAALLLTASAGGAAGGDEVPQPLSLFPSPFSPFPFPPLLSSPPSPLQHPTDRNAAPGKTNSQWVSGCLFFFCVVFCCLLTGRSQQRWWDPPPSERSRGRGCDQRSEEEEFEVLLKGLLQDLSRDAASRAAERRATAPARRFCPSLALRLLHLSVILMSRHSQAPFKSSPVSGSHAHP